MARNEEKANSMMNRWIAMKREMAAGRSGRSIAPLKPEKRPYLSSLCDNVPDADKWRRQILREIGEKITIIQNASLGEHRIRDLNDEINKLFRELRHWERRIVELGGPDHSKSSQAKILLADGLEVRGATGQEERRGYRYFGAARNLPDVQELFARREQLKEEEARRSRAELRRAVDHTYYGFGGAEEDARLALIEAEPERAAIQQAIDEWNDIRARKKEQGEIFDTDSDDMYGSGDEQDIAANLPTQQEIEKQLLERRKQQLLQQYIGE